MRQQALSLMRWMQRQPLQHIAQVGVGIKAVELG